jgi:Cytidylate kinase-like family
METHSGFEKCCPFIESHFHPDSRVKHPLESNVPRLVVTISRESGSGAHAVGEKLAEYLQGQTSKDVLPWMLFDRNLVERVLEEHNLPSRLSRFMPEDRVSNLTDLTQEMFGLHPPFWTLVELTAKTILHLAHQGNVILIGRGAHLVTRQLPHVFHVRLVGSLAKRIEYMQQKRSVGKKEALELVRNEDRGRNRYLKKYFNQEIDNPLLYHLVINTDLVAYEEAARIIGDAALHHLRQRIALLSESSGNAN